MAEPEHKPEAEHDEHKPGGAVDEDGQPETPTKAALDKRRKKNLTYTGIALGAIGVVVAIMTLRRGSSSTSGATVPMLDPNSTGTVAGMGSAGTTTGSNSGDPFASLESQLASNQAQSIAAQGSLTTALARLTSELHASGGANKGDQARSLAKVNAADYARVLPTGTQVEVIGQETAAGKYTGAQLALGAPLYAWIAGKWQQGINPKTAPKGTIFGTTTQFDPYIVQPGAKAPSQTGTIPPTLHPVANPPHA